MNGIVTRPRKSYQGPIQIPANGSMGAHHQTPTQEIMVPLPVVHRTLTEYVYVQNGNGIVHVVPQASHAHPKVLGGGKKAADAGEIIIDANGVVSEINNISGTFQHDASVLNAVKAVLEKEGLKVAPDAINPWKW